MTRGPGFARARRRWHLLERQPQGSPEASLVYPTRPALRDLSVNLNRGNRPDAEPVRLGDDVRRVHVVDDYLIGVATEPLYQVNGILTQGAARTKDFDPLL